MPDTNNARLREALATAFSATDVVVQDFPPSQFTAPSVVITPGDPYLEPDTQGLIREAWDVLAVVAFKERAVGVDQLRQLSLLVRAATVSVGGLWRYATGPRRPEGEQARLFVLSVNRVEFKFNPLET